MKSDSEDSLTGFCANGVTLVFRPSREFDAGDIGLAMLQSAVALGQIEPVLQMMEHWLGTTFEWRPCEVPAAPLDFWIDGSDAATGMPRTGCLIDPVLHPELPDWPAGYKNLFTLQPVVGSATLAVDCFSISSDDQSRIASGALMLLPASFSPAWLGSIHSQFTGDAELPVVIDIRRPDVPGCVVAHAAVAQTSVPASGCVTETAAAAVSQCDLPADQCDVRIQLFRPVSLPRISAVALRVGVVSDRLQLPVSLEGARVLVNVGKNEKDGECAMLSAVPASISRWSATLVRVGSGMGALLDQASTIPEAH